MDDATSPPTNTVSPQKSGYHAVAAAAVLADLAVDQVKGLSHIEVQRRFEAYGPNLLRHRLPVRTWRILLNQLESMVVWLLALAATVAFVLGDMQSGTAIAVVLVLNTAIGFFTELKAVRSVESLREIATVATRVRREGEVHEIPAQSLVPGDIVLLDGGDVVTADARLLEASNLSVDESLLTGESVPIAKSPETVASQTILAERTPMLFKGTAVTQGSAEAVVVATGMATELGQIATLAAEAEPEQSPLERRLVRLSGQLIWLTLAVIVMVAGAGIMSGAAPLLMFEAGAALAVAAIPEGLPVVATLALARGMWRMARLNALVERLGAVETLGATTVILTDKTGTLTENQMTVDRLVLPNVVFEAGTDLPQTPELIEALTVGALCSEAVLATPESGAAVGDPMEIALLRMADEASLQRDELLAKWPEVREEAFDPERRMMATVHRTAEGTFLVATKGAPEAILGHSDLVRNTADDTVPLDAVTRKLWLEHAQELAEKGLRVIALASKEAEQDSGDAFEYLTFLGLVGLHDPPRSDVPEAIASCRLAGIRIVMMTGDHAATAQAIAREIGLDADKVIEGKVIIPISEMDEQERERISRATVLARVSPRQKLDLVSLYQQQGEIVAVTGDGVNDAPSLKKADIGVAMGQRGTQVAKDAADMVLADDAFPTIVAAIREGRIIFDNIRSFVVYLLSCNLAEILVVGLAVLAGMPLPILPLQILFLNLVNDVFPAFALGANEGEADTMTRPPRNPQEPILAHHHWQQIITFGALIAFATLGALLAAQIWLGKSQEEAITISFLTLAFSQLWHVFNMRAPGSNLLINEVTRNPYVWAALGLCVLLLLIAVHTPPLAHVLEIQPVGSTGWALILSVSLLPLLLGQGIELGRASFEKSGPAEQTGTAG